MQHKTWERALKRRKQKTLQNLNKGAQEETINELPKSKKIRNTTNTTTTDALIKPNFNSKRLSCPVQTTQNKANTTRTQPASHPVEQCSYQQQRRQHHFKMEMQVEGLRFGADIMNLFKRIKGNTHTYTHESIPCDWKTSANNANRQGGGQAKTKKKILRLHIQRSRPSCVWKNIWNTCKLKN